MKKNFFLFFVFFLPIISFSQNADLKLYGFVKNDMFWDSRQTVAAREGHFLLFPSPEVLDPDGVDLNAAPSFNFLALQSRFGMKITGAEALGSKITGVIEGDFFAQSNDNINLFRLRHAYFKMNWDKTELLFGQYWIPMFITGAFPGTISFNTGALIQPFGRNPQVRLTQTFGPFKILAIANSQRDYSSRGPAGVTSTYLRNSTMPEFSGQIHFNVKNEDKDSEFLIGAGASYKTIVPEITTFTGYATNDGVSGFNAIAFTKLKLSKFTFKLEGIYGQNIPDVLSIGGFGVASVDSTTGMKTYSPINTMSGWTDLSYQFDKVEIGVFAGYTKNMGADKDIIGEIYGLGTNIENLYRVSPRISYKVNNVKFAFETEYTSATYGSEFNSKAVPTNLKEVSNIRLLFAAYYTF